MNTEGGGAGDRRPALLAWTLLAVALASIPVALAFAYPVRNAPALADVDPAAVLFPILGIVPFAVVGAIVASRRPRNPVGWLMLAIGLGIALSYLTGAIVNYDEARPGSVPAAAVVAWFSSNMWFYSLLLIPLLLSRFPDGRRVSPRWWVLDAIAFLLFASVVVMSLKPGELVDYEQYENPVGLGVAGRVAPVLEPAGLVLFLAILLGSAASLIVRYRRSHGAERLQLKWVAYAVALTAVFWIAGELAPGGWWENLFSALGLVALCAVPVAVGLAVLRFRLYDIDRVISRTLVYGSLTVVLGAVYVGLVLASQAIFSSVAGGGDLAIAVSTLVVAALFLPLRSRLQAVVDRRFYRRRYDTQRTLERFGTHLRDQIALEPLELELRRVVGETMQPATVTMWRRGG